MTREFKDKLRDKMDEFVHFVYQITYDFPKEELYSSVSQFRRAALSIILDYIEGYARRKPLVQLNFFEISFGSFKEAQYLLEFSYKGEFINLENYHKGHAIANEIGAMLWTEISALKTVYKN